MKKRHFEEEEEERRENIVYVDIIHTSSTSHLSMFAFYTPLKCP